MHPCTSLLQCPCEFLCISVHLCCSIPVQPSCSIPTNSCTLLQQCIPLHPFTSPLQHPCESLASLHLSTTESLCNSAHLCASLLQYLRTSLLQQPSAFQMQHPSCSIPAHLCAVSAWCALPEFLLQHPRSAQAEQAEKRPPWHRGVQGGNLAWFAIRMAAGASSGPEFLAECCAHSAYLSWLCLCSRSQPALWGEGHGRAPTEEHRAVLGIKSLSSLCTMSILGIRRDIGIGTEWCGTWDPFSSHLVLPDFPAPCPGKATAKRSVCIQAL